MNAYHKLVIVAAFAITWHGLSVTKQRDMDVCQLTHSYDTCFQALNR